MGSPLETKKNSDEADCVPGPTAYTFIHKWACGASVFSPPTEKCLRDNQGHRVERELTSRQLDKQGF